jgi:2',3'-cyclic-nucleotide 2'-phosphodiesterase (5'-nucleotidase family)
MLRTMHGRKAVRRARRVGSAFNTQAELKNSGSDWKIAYFHHPLYSSGMHGSQTDLRVVIEPLFLKYGVDVVFSGHEHFYQRIKPQKGIYYFVSGATGQLRPGVRPQPRP